MQKSVLNKQGKFGVKILRRYTDMAIFVLRCIILTHSCRRLGNTNFILISVNSIYKHTTLHIMHNTAIVITS